LQNDRKTNHTDITGVRLKIRRLLPGSRFIGTRCCKSIFAETASNMGKITEIKLAGQPVFRQVMNMVEKVDLTG